MRKSRVGTKQHFIGLKSGQVYTYHGHGVLLYHKRQKLLCMGILCSALALSH